MATAPADLLLILDTETTGLDESQDELLEIAAILYSVKHHCVLQQISTLIPGDRDQNPAEAINQIPMAAANATPVELSRYFCEIIGYWGEISQYIVAHNAEFDRKWFKRHPLLGKLYDRPWLCSCHDFTWPKQHRRGQKLIDLALAHGIGVSSAHRALTDCQLLAALFDRVEDLAERVAAAASPKVLVKAEVAYGDRHLAKDAGFRWDSAARQWVCKMSQGDLKALPFAYSLLETAENGPEAGTDRASDPSANAKHREFSENIQTAAVEAPQADPQEQPDVVPF